MPAEAMPATVAQRQPRLRQAVAAGEVAGRVGELAARASRPRAPSPMVPLTQIPSPGARPAAAQRGAGRDVAEDGQRQADRPGRRGGVAARAERCRIRPGRRPARRRSRRTRHPACRAEPIRSAGSRAAPRPWRRGRRGWCAAAFARSGRADRRAGNARPPPWRRRSTTSSRPGGGANTAASSARSSAPGPASGRKCRAMSANSAGSEMSRVAPRLAGAGELRRAQQARQAIQHAVGHARLLAVEEAVRHVHVFVDDDLRRRAVAASIVRPPPARISARSTGSSRASGQSSGSAADQHRVERVLLRGRGADDAGRTAARAPRPRALPRSRRCPAARRGGGGRTRRSPSPGSVAPARPETAPARRPTRAGARRAGRPAPTVRGDRPSPTPSQRAARICRQAAPPPRRPCCGRPAPRARQRLFHGVHGQQPVPRHRPTAAPPG